MPRRPATPTGYPFKPHSCREPPSTPKGQNLAGDGGNGMVIGGRWTEYAAAVEQKKINKQEEEQKWVEKLIVGQEENSDLFRTTKGHFHLNWVLNCTGKQYDLIQPNYFLSNGKITAVCMHALSARNSLEHILCSISGTFAAMHLP